MDTKKAPTKRELAIERANARKKKQKILTIIIALAAVLLIVGIVVGVCVAKDMRENPRAVITIKDYGKVVIKLDKENAPKTVERFIKLVNEGYYDGLPFDSIIDGSIYSGDPTATDDGGYKSSIFGEFNENGYTNNLSHTRGVISLARETDFNSGSSKFFILTKDRTELDGSYAAFGTVTRGLKKIDKIIEEAATDQNVFITEDSQPIIESIKMR